MHNRAYYATRAAVRLTLGTIGTAAVIIGLHMPAALLLPAMT